MLARKLSNYSHKATKTSGLHSLGVKKALLKIITIKSTNYKFAIRGDTKNFQDRWGDKFVNILGGFFHFGSN